MANEARTEAIVRKHFEPFESAGEIEIEEKQSSNPKIDKLLRSGSRAIAGASKRGAGSGYPDFIVQFKHDPDLVIIVECKADTRWHESKTRQKYADYAVDGALLYAAHLSKSYDVLAIAVSGDTKASLKVSHFLHLKGQTHAAEIFGNKLLPPADYRAGYIGSPQKFNQDYAKLLAYSKELNEKLHGYKILESDRSLLISCILIALENESFYLTYRKKKTPALLAKYLIDTVIEEFVAAQVQPTKVDILKQRYSFIQTDTSLSTEEDVLRGIIDDIDEHIRDFMKTHAYFDALGQLYIEFLRYANSDKGLGIVLTPPHITEFMAEVAEVNQRSCVYDSCTGTGGFLISAMNLMIEGAKGDQAMIQRIKHDQLVGVEYQAHIFALACSNMFIHQDGKTNIILGSCFDERVKQEVRTHHPTVGLLNPPYKADKKNDPEELLFVLENLDCLEQGGKCVAIIPMQSALSQKGKILQLKRQLLERHTLEAVFSMPDELFFNSNVGVVSCIMVFTAGLPHPKGKRTYFGYYKNDGFVKRKTKGRVDLAQVFENRIKDEWLTHYRNRDDIPGISVTRAVTAEDEWSAEAYMLTDSSQLTRKDFEDSVLAFVTYGLANRRRLNVNHDAVLPDESLELTDREWRYFGLTAESGSDNLSPSGLFTITGTKTTSALELEELGWGFHPYVTTQATNNGVEGFYNGWTENGGVLTVDSAVLGYCAYQRDDFLASDHVEKLIPHGFELNPFVALFLVTVINAEQYRYNYGRKCSQARMKSAKISLPCDEYGNPDWAFMEGFIKSLPYTSSIDLGPSKVAGSEPCPEPIYARRPKADAVEDPAIAVPLTSNLGSR